MIRFNIIYIYIDKSIKTSLHSWSRHHSLSSFFFIFIFNKHTTAKNKEKRRRRSKSRTKPRSLSDLLFARPWSDLLLPFRSLYFFLQVFYNTTNHRHPPSMVKKSSPASFVKVTCEGRRYLTSKRPLASSPPTSRLSATLHGQINAQIFVLK